MVAQASPRCVECLGKALESGPLILHETLRPPFPDPRRIPHLPPRAGGVGSDDTSLNIEGLNMPELCPLCKKHSLSTEQSGNPPAIRVDCEWCGCYWMTTHVPAACQDRKSTRLN